MTVNELIKRLQKIADDGNGNMTVVAYSNIDEGADDINTAYIVKSSSDEDCPYVKGSWFWDEPVVCIG